MNQPDSRPEWATRLRQARCDRGWTQEDVVHHMRAAAGYSLPEDLLTSYKRYERGKHFPVTYAPILATVFDTDADTLFGPRRRFRPPVAPATDLSNPNVVLHTASVEDEDDDDVRRRTLLGLVGQAAASHHLVGALEGVREGLDRMLLVAPTDRDAEDWEHAVAAYATSPPPVLRLIGDMLSDFKEIERRIAQANEPLRTRLIHSGARLATLTAIGLLEVGQHRSAERWWRTASRAAEATYDPQLIALVSGRRAVLSVETAPSTRVLSLADEAIARGRNVACVGVISAFAARAQTLSHSGRHTEASVALQHVTDMFERLPTSTTIDRQSRWGWAEQRLRHVESHVHAYAGRLDEALAAQDAAFSRYPARNYQGRTQVAMHQSVAMIKVGNVDDGVKHMMVVHNGLTARQRSDGLVLQRSRAVLATVPHELRGRSTVRAAVDAIRSSVSG